MRRERNVRQTDLANLLGIFQKKVSYWERGYLQPDNASVAKLANYFNVSADYIRGKDVAPEPACDDESLELLEQIQTRDEIRTLLSILKDASKEEIESVVKVVDRLKRVRNENSG